MGSDYIGINEDNINDKELLLIPRVHLIKLNFSSPTSEKVKEVISNFPKTNRFVVEDNIKIYNSVLKRTSKKYYVQNREGIGLISFFRKNNKVLLDITRLNVFEKQFILSSCLEDVLRNIEVVKMKQEDYIDYEDILKLWKGNVIIDNPEYLI
jgi:hypothetical protein